MAVVTAPVAITAAAALVNGQGGVNLADAAVDAANGNKISGLDNNSLLVFRTTAAGTVVVTVYCDVNGQEAAIDSFTVQGNATAGGVRLYKPPKGVNWVDHNTSVSTATGSLVFKSASANLNAAAYPQTPAT